MPLWVDRERALFSAWYELFPRSEGGFAGRHQAAAGGGRHGLRRRLPAAHPPDRAHLRKGRNNTPRARPRRPGQPVGDRRRPRAATPRSHPELGTLEDFDAFVARAQRARHGGGARLRPAVLARPPLGHRAPRVVPPPARRHDQVRREPAQEVPGHLPDQLLAGRRRPTGRRCGTRARRSSTSGSARASGSSGSTTPTPSRWRSGSGSSPRCRPSHPDVAVPGRGVHPPEGDGQAGRGRLHPELHVLHLAQHQGRARRVPRPSCAQGPMADYMRPNFWPNTPDILAGPCAAAAPAPSGCGCCWPPRWSRPTASTPATSCARTSRSPSQRGVPRVGEVRDQAPRLLPSRAAWRRSSPGSTTSAARHPAFAELRQHAFHHSDNDQILCWSKVDRAADDVMLMVVNLDPAQHAGGHALPRPRRAGLRLATSPTRRSTSSPARRSPGGRRPVRAPRPGRCPATSCTCAALTGPEGERVDRHERARPDRRALVPAGRLLRGLRPGLLRRQRRRHRRPPGPDREARLPGVAGRRLPLAAALLPVAPARRRLRHQRLLHHPPRVRQPRRRRASSSRRRTSGASASSPTW